MIYFAIPEEICFDLAQDEARCGCINFRTLQGWHERATRRLNTFVPVGWQLCPTTPTQYRHVRLLGETEHCKF